MASCEQQGRLWDVWDTRARSEHTGTVCASLCGRNPLRVVGLSRDTATGRRARRAGGGVGSVLQPRHRNM